MSILGESEKTLRGFGAIKFIDLYGAECSLQQSSIATDNAVWLGIDRPEVKVLRNGWKDVEIPEDALISGRMHLNREQVLRLVIQLNKWLDTGEID